jgi:DNA-binding NarL/FixJ family response regulator
MSYPRSTGVVTSLRPQKLRLLLANESTAVRGNFRQQVERLAFAEVVAEATRSEEALELFFRLRPSVAVVSVCLPGHGGFDVLRCIKRAAPDCAVFLTTRWPNPCVEQAASLLGASGVCYMTDGPTQLVGMLQRIFDRRLRSRPLRVDERPTTEITGQQAPCARPVGRGLPELWRG